ncbi:MAG TPA: DPP IV N-terminal domain-containing protein, partial [Candidatus Dormibacteraeota bacterium]|nr:DPP IV N-terminal domain-containing protein [Candidatus Dormibacteraeota bacterium]
MKTVERSRLTPELAARFPRPGMATPGKIDYSPDSKFVTYLFSERGDLARDLWRLDLSSGKAERWLTPPGEGVTEANISRQEALRRERLRLRETGITDYIWAEKANVLLLPLRGELFRWSESGMTRIAADGVIDPKISADGSRVFFIRDGDVWTIDHGRERRLTAHPPATTNGLAEFVAQEELGRMSGYWPSPSGDLVAFEQLDASNIPIYPIVHQGKAELQIEEHRYPFAGAANARVKLGVVDARSGAITFMDLGIEDGYIARVQWHPDGRLFVQWLSRDWRQLEILAYDVSTGGGRGILVERQEPWINLHDDLRILESTGEFVWSSERSGYRHLYLYAPDGRLIRQLTSGDWPAEATVGLDEKRRQLYFVGWQETPLERQLFRVSLDAGPIEQLTTDAGMHGAEVAPDFTSFIDVWSSRQTPPTVTVRSLSGGAERPVHSPAEIDLELRPPEFHRFRNRDGIELHAALYFPPPSTGEGTVGAAGGTVGARPPVIVSVYGGPGPQMVNESWGQTVDLSAQLLAQHGFVVLKVDNRGSARRGLAFEAPIARNLGEIEVNDQVDGVRWLGTLGVADSSRVGVIG